MAKTDIQKTKALIGCNSPDNIPGEFHALIGNQLCKITIKITATIVTPRDPVMPKVALMEDKASPFVLIGERKADRKGKGLGLLAHCPTRSTS